MSLLNWFDPSFWIVTLPIRYLIVFKEKKLAERRAVYEQSHSGEEIPEELQGLYEGQLTYVRENVVKHRVCLWAIALITLVLWRRVLEIDTSRLDAFFLMGSALISGLIVGWFAMSLKSLPDRYGFLGILITGFMFTAFMGGAMLIPVVVMKTGDIYLTVGAAAEVVLLYCGTLLYDFADLLNLGLEPLQKKYFENPYVKVMGDLIEAFRSQAAINQELLAVQKEILAELKVRPRREAGGA